MRLIQEGPRDARIMLVGEAPGANEDATGKPFVGGAGEVLNKILSNVGISRTEVFITNVCHVRPPKNDFRWFLKPKIRPEFMHGVVQLKADIEAIKPNIVVPLGTHPLKVLTGRAGIEKWRGSILESTLVSGLKVVGTYHPAYILRVYDYKAVAEFDFQRIASEASHPEILLPHRDLRLHPPYTERQEIIAEMEQAEWLAVDIECTQTDSGKWRLACVGFSDRADRALVIACDSESSINDIRRLCISNTKKVFQNGQFDVSVLLDEGIAVNGWASDDGSPGWDTMLAHHALYTECASGSDEISALAGKKRQSAIAKGLAFQASVYTREPYYKDDGKLWKETQDLQMFWRYNALDAAVTREIRDVQESSLNEFGTMDVLRHEMSLVWPLLVAGRRGVRIDMEYRAALREKVVAEIDNLQKFLDAGAGGSLNVKSPKAIQSFLYDKLGLPIKYNRKSGNPTADKDAIIELAQKSKHPLLHTILQIRQRRDYVERYLDAIVDKDDRIRCNFDITGTRTGRLASRQSIYGSGTNLQNIPSRQKEGRLIRQMFIPDEGKVFIQADYSQAEARIVAYLARSELMIDLFEDPSRDIHTENAARIFNKPIESISYNERYLAKKVIHASNYGMGPNRLVQVVNEDSATTGIAISIYEAKSLMEKYFLLFPEIRENFWGEVARELRQSRTLTNAFGRKRTFYGRWDDKLIRDSYAYIPQSTIGDLCCKAVANVYNNVELQIPGAEFMLTVHDSILMQCWPKDVGQVIERMREAMHIPFKVGLYDAKIPMDFEVGSNWNKYSDDNPTGLKEWQNAA